MAKPPPPFHNPFTAAQGELKKLVPKPAPKTGAPKPAAPAPAPKPPDEGRLFADEMQGVVRLSEAERQARLRARSEPPEPGSRPSRRAMDEAEAYAELADLVDGGGPFDIGLSDEFIEGLGPGIDKRLLRRLRRGEFALQGHVDLHGMTREQARAAVERFITESRQQARRCVLIVHGRGLNSKDQIPVLKERVKSWLERGRIARGVIAFCTAQPWDGGAGAVYVLLRR